MRHGNGVERNRARLGLERLEERAVPTIFTVTNLNDGGAGSLRQALTAANAAPNPDIIQFAAGLTGAINLTSPGSDDTNVGGDLDILYPVSIQGPGANLLTVRQAVADERVFDVRPPAGETVFISRLTITGGNGHGDGGGARLSAAASLILSAVDITGNSLATDTGTGGGGIAIEFPGSSLTLIDSTIANNSALFGGGIEFTTGSATITNSTISGNTAVGSAPGGGVRVGGGSVVIRNSTIAGNTATTGGGVGIFAGQTVTLSSTIVAGNNGGAGGDVDGRLQDASDNNLIGNNTGLLGMSNGVNGNLVGTAANPIDPRLGPLQFNGGTTRTRALLAGSPAINAGFNFVDLASDQRGTGFSRLVGANVDIGAFEVQPPSFLPPGQGQPPTVQALQAALQLVLQLDPSSASLAGGVFAEVSGDSVRDIVLAFRLRNGRLLVVSFDGNDGHIRGVFQAFTAPVRSDAKVRLLTVDVNPDPGDEIVLVVNSGGPGVPRLSVFTETGRRLL
jgi:hypothetical protein